MTSSIRTDRPRGTIAVIVLALLSAISRPIHAAGEDGAPATASARDEARAIFNQGQARYDLGAYAEAADLFTRAYEKSPSPTVLFSIGQARRRQGDCPTALKAYRSFLRLAPPDDAQRGVAEQHVADLSAQCPEPAPVAAAPPPPPSVIDKPPLPAPPPPPPAPLHQETAPAPRAGWDGRRWGLLSLAAATVVGGTAAGLYLWNDSRHARWQRTDRELATAPDDPSLVGRQNSNDSLLRSIRTVDRVSAVLAVGSWALLATAAALPLVTPGRSGVTVTAGPERAALGWRQAW